MSNRIETLDKGYVELVGHTVDFEDLETITDVDSYGEPWEARALPDDLTLDAQIVRSARVSYGEGTKTKRSDAGLIDYLMRHAHTSPFEQVSFRFQVKAPLFVIQQWIRHRTAKLNQESGRYSVLAEEFYFPDLWRGQDEVNKQGSQGEIGNQDEAAGLYRDATNFAGMHYQFLLDLGVAREQARIVMPPSTYTRMVWKIDLHNLMHFLALRMDEHAQQEIRVFAQAMYDLVRPLVPLAMDSFENHVLNAVTFSGDEMQFVRAALRRYAEMDVSVFGRTYLGDDLEAAGLSKSRRREFLEKLGIE